MVSAPQEDAKALILSGQAQLALMFEREQLETSEQFVELKREVLVPVAGIDYPLAHYEYVTFEQILQSRQIVVASRDRNIKPELLFSKQYWRTDNHQSACSIILKNLAWGILPIKILNFLDFTPKFEYFVDLVWSRESRLGAAAHFLIQYVQNQRKS